MPSGTVTNGIQTMLAFDDTNGDARMHQYLSYTGTSLTCEVADYDDWATDSLLFAGVSMIRAPYVSYAELLSSPYTAEDWTIPYDAQPASWKSMVTVENLCVTIGLAAEDITSGQGLMLADVADHTSYKHDGMFSPNDAGSTAAEMYATVGIARTNVDVPTSHDNHDFDKDDFDETAHPRVEMLLWR